MGRLTFKKFFKHYRYGMETTTVCVSGYTQIVEPEETATGETSHYYLVGEAVDKLAEYESLEEQGLLIRLPCKLGDVMWGLRHYHGILHAQQGIVSEMFFTQEMKLMIVVKHVARGEFGKTVFRTKAEAEQAMERRKNG